MSEIIQIAARPLPSPRLPIEVRPGTGEDIAFMDRMQKLHSKALGFFPRAQMEGYIDGGNVLIAEVASSSQPSACSELNTASCKPEAVGYCISRDRYLKRDELGAVFQLCVAPGHQRGFIGANLLREVFERAAYGCKLFCCWCAQDLPANKFWEAMGFVPIAYRCGGKSKVRKSKAEVSAGDRDSELRTSDFAFRTSSHRIHIFWQKRIRAGDVTTPYWFPAKTEGGAIREDRIILPIPPGMRWRDELPILTPERAAKVPTLNLRPGTKAKRIEPTKKLCSGARFGPPGSLPDTVKLEERIERREAEAKADQVKAKADRVKPKAHPELIARARELRDKWMDHVAANGIASAESKYALARTTPATERLLPELPARLAA